MRHDRQKKPSQKTDASCKDQQQQLTCASPGQLKQLSLLHFPAFTEKSAPLEASPALKECLKIHDRSLEHPCMVP